MRLSGFVCSSVFVTGITQKVDKIFRVDGSEAGKTDQSLSVIHIIDWKLKNLRFPRILTVCSTSQKVLDSFRQRLSAWIASWI